MATILSNKDTIFLQVSKIKSRYKSSYNKYSSKDNMTFKMCLKTDLLLTTRPTVQLLQVGGRLKSLESQTTIRPTNNNQ